jgi:hypothetical protein
MNPGYGGGRGFGRGFGRGYGRGHGRGLGYGRAWGGRGWVDDRWGGPYWGPAPQEPVSGTEAADLQARLTNIQAELEALRQRLNDLQQEKD